MVHYLSNTIEEFWKFFSFKLCYDRVTLNLDMYHLTNWLLYDEMKDENHQLIW